MSHPDFPQVLHDELEQRVKRALHSERVSAWVLLAVSLGLVIFWFKHFAPIIPWWGLGIFTVSLFWLLGQSDIPGGVLVEDADPEKLGKYTPEQIHAIVREVCETFYEKEIPSVYVVEDTAEAVAAVVNVDVLNFIRPWNAIYIGPHLLHALDPEELKAVLSHEMCHFSIHYTFWTRFFYLKFLIFAVWMTVAGSYAVVWTSGFLENTSWIVSLLLLYMMLQLGKFTIGVISLILATWTARPDSQEVEALCDYEAAKRYGLLPMVNVLLKLGTRQEIFTTLVAQLSPELEHPFESIQEEADALEDASTEERELLVTNQTLAIQNAYMHLNENLPLDFISLEESAPYIEEAVNMAREETDAKRYKQAPRHVIRWLKHDINVANQKLDVVEYSSFIQELKENPDKALFYVPEEFDEELAEEADHPTIRNRILFLEYNQHASQDNIKMGYH